MTYESKYENPSTLKMDYVHTEAHQMAYDLSVYLHRKVMDMPHYEKFTLQKDIRESIDGIMDEIEAYEKSKNNQPPLCSRQAERKTGSENPNVARS